MAFERKDAGNFTDDEGVARDVETIAQEQIVGGVNEWFNVESAEDAGVQLGRRGVLPR